MDDAEAKLIRFWARQLRQGDAAPDFFELVRRIEAFHPDKPRVGCAEQPSETPVRFGQTPYLRFPETSVAEIREADPFVRVPRILVYFMGLLGVNGPMPLEFTNYVFQRSHNYYDMTLRRFLDIIHHRMISLFCRAWRMSEQSALFDRPDDDLIGDAASALAGGMEERGRGGTALSPYFNRAYGAFLGMTLKSRAGLEAVLSSYFRLPLTVSDFVESEYDLPNRFRCAAGRRNVRLGVDFQIGGRYRSISGKFAVRIGPVDFQEAGKLLPGTRGFDRFNEIVDRCTDRPLVYDAVFTIRGPTIPRAVLGGPFALGRSLWLGRARDREKPVTLTLGYSRLAKSRSAHYSSAASKQGEPNHGEF